MTWNDCQDALDAARFAVFGEEASYRETATSAATPARVILRQEVLPVGDFGAVLETRETLTVRASEAPAPRRGSTFTCGARVLTVSAVIEGRAGHRWRCAVD